MQDLCRETSLRMQVALSLILASRTFFYISKIDKFRVICIIFVKLLTIRSSDQNMSGKFQSFFSDSRTLFVKNFPASFKEKQLKELSPDIKNVRVRTSKNSKTPFQ